MSYKTRLNSTGTASTQLTAPGNGDGVVDCEVNSTVNLQLETTVASIDTSVSYRMQYSSVSNFASDTVLGPLRTVTANGVHGTGESPMRRYARPVFAAEAGGTAATVNFVVYKILK